ncbi:MAG: trypsin-like peptidase domain-containing protein [Acidobacteria bacterium]|nr:trypsin-like peptidase domain-containing protein [Acidobacteriota bacterium]
MTPVVAVVRNVLPSVVNIQVESTMTRRSFDPWFDLFRRDRIFRTQSAGSGFIWSSDGTVVTNAHVIEGASAITVNLADGRSFEARVIGVDPDSDLAVLELDAGDLPAAPIGTSSDLMIGETVVAIGNPFGLSGTVTTGVISATGRSVPSAEQDRTFTDFIQTDASINPGNSGGPLVNMDGRIIGINVAIYAEAQGIGFAIPVDRARKIVEDLRRYGEVHPAWIGLATATLTPEESHRLGLDVGAGAIVTRVFDDSPAADAGIELGDVIVSVAGAPVDSREALVTILTTARAGEPIEFRVRRERDDIRLAITPSEAPRRLGLRVLRAVSGLSPAESGGRIVIDRVDRGSRADQIGLVPGDLIVGVNGVTVRSVEELDAILARSVDRTSIVLSIARGRRIYTLTFPIGR